MTEIPSSNATATTSSATRVQQATAKADPANASSNFSATIASTATKQPSVQPISPTMQEDPVAGVMVTKYLSGNGDVQMQIPSTVALAYLRVGLTATGELKNDPNAVAANAANKGVVA